MEIHQNDLFVFILVLPSRIRRQRPVGFVSDSENTRVFQYILNHSFSTLFYLPPTLRITFFLEPPPLTFTYR